MTEKVDLGGSGKLLERDLSLAATKQIREVAGASLREVVDEGLAVFQRCSVTARGKDEQLGILFPFLHLIELLDGAETLLDSACVVPAHPVLRSAFESLLTLEYVTEEAERRAAAYVVAEIHRRLQNLDRHDPTSQLGREYAASLARDRHAPVVSIPGIRDISARRAGLQSLLQEPHLAEASQEYERTRKAMKRRPAFYSLWDGPPNIERLAEHLGRSGHYDILYRDWSDTAHSVNLSRQLRSSGDLPAIARLRSGEGLTSAYAHAIGFGVQAINRILSHYRPQELRDFWDRWYRNRVRPGYMAVTPNPDDEQSDH
jgi:hypothetical protein